MPLAYRKPERQGRPIPDDRLTQRPCQPLGGGSVRAAARFTPTGAGCGVKRTPLKRRWRRREGALPTSEPAALATARLAKRVVVAAPRLIGFGAGAGAFALAELQPKRGSSPAPPTTRRLRAVTRSSPMGRRFAGAGRLQGGRSSPAGIGPTSASAASTRWLSVSQAVRSAIASVLDRCAAQYSSLETNWARSRLRSEKRSPAHR